MRKGGRTMDTKIGQNSFKEVMLHKGYWKPCPDKKDCFHDLKNKYRYKLSQEKWEIEVYKKIDGEWPHFGIVRPSEGVIRTEFAVPGRKLR